MPHLSHLTSISVSLLILCSAHPAYSQPDQPAAPTQKLSALEKKFAAQLTGGALVGRFTVDGRDPSAAREERYEIASATKLRDDYWVILARVKYGQHDLKVPVTLKVLWAGDTPVMSLTDLAIPLLGTFTARVMFYGDRYVGTWQHGKVGGHMFGTVEASAVKREAPAQPAKPNSATSPSSAAPKTVSSSKQSP
ncbi:MAG: hypothetical protein ABGZ17_23655 [Planctomycetaceae bacterium]